MCPDRLSEARCRETTLSGCRRLQATPGQLQKPLDLFHDASKPLDGLDIMDLKETSASSSAVAVVVLLLPGGIRACEQRHNNENQSSVIAPSMRRS